MVKKENFWYFNLIGGSSNGRTLGFGPRYRGSSPCPPAVRLVRNTHFAHGYNPE